MPRQSKRPRLWLRPERHHERTGKLIARATWIVLDGGKQVATGCAEGEADKADRFLSAYLTEKHAPPRTRNDLEGIPVADVLSIYFDDCGPRQANQRSLNQRLLALTEFWGLRNLADVTGTTCREYARHRGNSGSARRELEDLRAAINHHSKEGFHRGNVRVVLPPKGVARDRWLTRNEIARLLWVCWQAKEIQKTHRGVRKGEVQSTARRPLRHLARFILIGLYTGTRAGAIATASPYRQSGTSFVDLDEGIFYRLAEGKTATKKRQPPVPIPPRLLAHMRRWVDRGIVGNHLVEWNGRPVVSVKTAFATAVRLADITGKVSPHTLRHTAATWLMQAGVPKWEAAGFSE